MLNLHDEYPALRKFRGNRSGQCRYFGPYASATAVNEVMDVIQKFYAEKLSGQCFSQS